MKSTVEWKDNNMCFACGRLNPRGLQMQFTPVEETGLRSEVTLGPEYQGFQDIVHGGFLGLLLDEVIVNLPWQRWQQPVVTAELTLRFHQPAPVGKRLVIKAFPDGVAKGRLVPLRGEVRLESGELLASARAKCIRVKADISQK